MFCSCRISTNKCLAQSLCNSRATCKNTIATLVLTILKMAAVRHLWFLKISFFWTAFSILRANLRQNEGTCVPCIACVASGWKPALTEASHQTFHIFTTRCYAKRGICRRCVSVCLSVTLWYCIKIAKHRITHVMLHDSPGNLVFCRQKSLQNSNGITPYGSDKCRWGGLKLVTFDKKRAITGKRYKIAV